MKLIKAEDWLSDLMPRLPGATEELIVHETFSAIREFCEDGRAWVDNLGPLSSKANNKNIYLNPQPGNVMVGYVYMVLFKGNSNFRKKLTPMSDVASYITTGQDPTGFYMEDTGLLTLNPVPTIAHDKAYTVVVSLIPTNINTQFPQEFLTHWRDAVIDGTCGRMMLMQSKPWSNASLALHHGKRFRNFIKRTRNLTRNKYTSGQSWLFPNFAKQRFGGLP